MIKLWILTVFLLGAVPQGSDGSVSSFLNYSDPDSNQASVIEKVFRDAESGIVSGDAGLFSKHFGKQLYVSLPGSESGYYSSNQALYILQNYFKLHHTIRFRLTTVKTDEKYPYATGGGSFQYRGTVVTLQIYLSVTRQDNRWTISQFNVY